MYIGPQTALLRLDGTIEGVTFLERHAAAASRGFYRTAQGRTLSTLGIGTYLGELSEAADRAYTDAVVEAVAAAST